MTYKQESKNYIVYVDTDFSDLRDELGIRLGWESIVVDKRTWEAIDIDECDDFVEVIEPYLVDAEMASEDWTYIEILYEELGVKDEEFEVEYEIYGDRTTAPGMSIKDFI